MHLRELAAERQQCSMGAYLYTDSDAQAPVGRDGDGDKAESQGKAGKKRKERP